MSDPLRHSVSGYNSGCRCASCKEAKRVYMRHYMRAARAARAGHAPTFTVATAHKVSHVLDEAIARYERTTRKEAPPEISFLREVASRVGGGGVPSV